jgi:tellurite resistance protein TehA-like permease
VLFRFACWNHVDDNGMQGKIPTEIALLTSLNEMNFNKSSLSGTFPLEIYSLTNLRSLWVENKGLLRTLSTEIGVMLCLVDLDLKVRCLRKSEC